MKIMIDTQEIEITDAKLSVINQKLDTAAFINEIEIAVNSTINLYALAGQAVIDKEIELEHDRRLELLKSADVTLISQVDELIGYTK